MTVKELIELLKEQPQDHEVMITSGKYGSPCNITSVELGAWDGYLKLIKDRELGPDHIMEEDEETNCLRLVDDYDY